MAKLLLDTYGHFMPRESHGLVNEVVSRDGLMKRAWEIAERFTSRKRLTQRMSVQALRRPWKRRLHEDLDVGWSTEMWAYLGDEPSQTAAPTSQRDAGAGTSDTETSGQRHP